MIISTYPSLRRGLGLLTQLAADLDALQEVLTVFVELELGDDHLGRVDSERHRLAGRFVASHLVDVDDVLETVNGVDLALAVLVGAADDHDFVVLVDGHGADLRRGKLEFGPGVWEED